MNCGRVKSPYYLSAYSLAQRRGFQGTEDEWLESLKVKGDPGKSAYEYAVEAGYQGTEEGFAEHMGQYGKTAYEYAVDGGFTGSVEDFQRKLAGEYLPLGGGKMTGSIDMGGKKITNLETPTAEKDAVNKAYADEIKTAAGKAQTSADNAKTAADNAKTAADNAKAAADNAKALANAKTSNKKTTVTLSSGKWVDNMQTVSVDGVNPERVNIVGPVSADLEKYAEAGVRCTEEEEGKLTFSCRVVPEADLKVNVVILDNSGNLGDLTQAEWEARILGGAS